VWRSDSPAELSSAESVLHGSRWAAPVELAVTSDVADEIHLHGYNETAQVAAGTTATLTFVANTPGTFEVELENRGAKLVDIQVR
jgi:hypothetical protein